MIVTVVATLCTLATHPACVEEIITDQATLSECTQTAESAIAKWMSEHPLYRSGWRLAKWGCAIGGYHKAVPV